MKGKKNILAIINLNYSGFEVILSYFYYLNLKKKNYNFFIFVGEFSIYERLKKDLVYLSILENLNIRVISGNFKRENSFKFYILNKLSFFFPKKYYFFFFYNFNFLYVLNIFLKSDFILHEYGNDLKYTGIINFINLFKKKKIFLFNSATAPEFFLKYDRLNHGKIDVRKDSTFLLYDFKVKDVYSKMGFSSFFETGYLRYDKKWLDYKIRYCSYHYKIKKKIIVIFSKNYPDQHIEKNLRLKTFKRLINIINNYHNFEILIKPHPRDNIKILETITSNFSNVKLTYKDSMYLILNSEFIISLSSSIIFDALILKKKHIDFYLKEAMRHQPSGSRWKKLGILSTSSFDEFEEIIRLNNFKFNTSLIDSLPLIKLPNF